MPNGGGREGELPDSVYVNSELRRHVSFATFPLGNLIDDDGDKVFANLDGDGVLYLERTRLHYKAFGTGTNDLSVNLQPAPPGGSPPAGSL